MVLYAKVVGEEVVETSSRPTSSRTSNLWLHPDLMLLEGWYPVVDDAPPLLAFAEYIGSYSLLYVEVDSLVRRSAVVVTRTLEAEQEDLLRRAKEFVERKMQELFGGVAAQVARRAGDLGITARDDYLSSQTTYIKGYTDFRTAVLGVVSLVDLEVVYNDYKHLLEDVA